MTLRSFLRKLIQKWWRRKPPPQPSVEPPPVVATEIPPTPTPTPTRKSNRHERRKLERARRRHDRFVEPQGPQPIKQVRANTAIKSKKQPVPIDAPEEPSLDHDPIVADEWLKGDGGGDVLYEWSEFSGEFNFRDTILDQLDRYWVYLRRMKKYDADAYGFYKQLGATLVPYAATDSFSDKPTEEDMKKVDDLARYKSEIELPAWFKQNWPAFGCIAYGVNPRDEARESVRVNKKVLWNPKFIYFRRVRDMPWTVQPVRGGKLYKMTVWWDHTRNNFSRWGIPQEFALRISDDGKNIRVLKTREDHGKIRPWWDWRIPHEFEEWARSHGLDVQTHLAHIFCSVATKTEYAAYSMLRVEVIKNDMTAMFGLDPRRASYFFQDRDIVLNDAGLKKRIFHVVRPHIRSDGIAVPMHFRGMRDFTWAGYQVRITVPGRDHFPLLAFDVPSSHEVTGKDVFREPKLATFLKDAMRNNVGAKQ